MPRCLVAIIRFRNILLLLTHVDAVQRKSYEYHSPWDLQTEIYFFPPSVGPLPCVAELNFIPYARIPAPVFIFWVHVCLVCRMKLFSKDIPQRKTFFTILGKGGIDYLVSACVLAVSSSLRVFYSDSKIKHFPKNTSRRGKRLFAVHVVCITRYLKVLLVSWKFVSQFKKYKNLLLVVRHCIELGNFLLFVIFLSNTSSLGETRLGCVDR